MRIALMIDALSLGGAQKHLLQLGRALRSRGDQVSIFCLNDNIHPSYREILAASGIRLIVLGATSVAFGYGLITTSVRLRRMQIDILVTMLFVSTVFGRAASMIAGGIPVLTSIQARNIDYKPWQLILLNATSPLTTTFVSNSRSAAEFAQRHEIFTGANCGLVRNAIDALPHPFAECAADISIPQTMAIGSVGRLHWQKGFDVLLRGFAVLRVHFPELILVLVGEGPEKKSLEELSERLGLRNVYFLGERANIRETLERLTVYVQPSRFEGTPNATMEAMALGLPIVASKVDGCIELLDGDRNGWGVEPDDVKGLVEAITTALNDETESERRGRAAQDFVFSRYSTPEMLSDYSRYIEAAVFRIAARQII